MPVNALSKLDYPPRGSANLFGRQNTYICLP